LLAALRPPGEIIADCATAKSRGNQELLPGFVGQKETAMTYNDPNTPYEPPPNDDSSRMWAAVAIIVLIILAGAVYTFTNRADQTASTTISTPTTTGSGSGDSRMAPPPPAPSK
jgi:hypothetical protein